MNRPHSNFTRRNVIGAIATLIATPATAWAAKVNAPNGVAILGYDPVAYISQSEAVKGDASIQADHDGATYYFASTHNREAFLADPPKYVPQYGGYCAYAVSEGYTAKIDPEAFSVVDGNLYLNYSRSVHNIWQKDSAERIESADKNWPALSQRQFTGPIPRSH